jgi:hypothetical protein
MSVIGFDGHDMADLFDLTTIAQPVVRQGEIAAELLLSLLGREYPSSIDLSGDGATGGEAAARPADAGLPGDSPDIPVDGNRADSAHADPDELISIVIPTSIQVRGTTCPPRERKNDTPPAPSIITPSDVPAGLTSLAEGDQ